MKTEIQEQSQENQESLWTKMAGLHRKEKREGVEGVKPLRWRGLGYRAGREVLRGVTGAG